MNSGMNPFDKIKKQSDDVFDSVISKEPDVDWKTRLPFGKYKGKKLEFVLEHFPEYLDWLLDQDLDRYPKLNKFLRLNSKEIHDHLKDEDSGEHDDAGDRY